MALMVCPHKLLYITLEGMVPRTKMNQQRPRRFCLPREMAEVI